MMIYLTSFYQYHRSTHRDRVPGYSIARWQPKWYQPLPALRLFHPGQIRPRDFGGDLQAYHETLLVIFRQRYTSHDQRKWPWKQNGDIALCCWCPYAKAATRQIKEFGTFVCHSWPAETFLKELGLEVIRDGDRKGMM